MSDGEATFMILLALWACWSIAGVAAPLRRIAAALERLVTLAERGRQ
jgi:hypothetical protein